MAQDTTIDEQARELARGILARPAMEEDIAIVEHQLGRYPRGMVAVGARCVCGRPLAVVTRPLLPGGVPDHLLSDRPRSGEGDFAHRSRGQDEGIQ